MNENLNSGRSNPDDANDEWSSLMKKSNELIEENYLDDQAYIESKQKKNCRKSDTLKDSKKGSTKISCFL